MKKITKEEVWKLPVYNKCDTFIESNENVSLCSIVGNDITLIDNIIKKLNGANEISFQEQFSVNAKYPLYIQYNNKNVLLMRGWGYLTGTGTLNLPVKEAEKIQDNMRDWIVDMLNR